ncbi:MULTISPECIES: 2'-5' RNA ligase family protein [unclassified Acinetobacter]|uniref:2'-5' RNA ligase family protein n=1 Tax=unclassified Acinetobacter TaxID=196816 RepID=UPI0015D3429C
MFLKPSTQVVPTLNQDYPDWHQGRQHYALWYLEIQDPKLLEYLTALRAQFSDLLYTPNTRQFHITVFICGFFEELNKTQLIDHSEQRWNDNFSADELALHQQQLRQLSLSNIRLRTGQIHSFQSALFIEILDLDRKFDHLRQAFNVSSNEIAPIEYCPHITLGLYKQAWNSDDIFERIQQVEQHCFDFESEQLTFGHYQAQVLQGALSPYYQHQFRQNIEMAQS